MKVNCHIENITCSSCVSAVERVIKKQGGIVNYINPLNGKCEYDIEDATKNSLISNALRSSGYPMTTDASTEHRHEHSEESITAPSLLKDKSLLFCLCLCVPLIAPHLFSHDFALIQALHNPFLQLALTLPILFIGWKRIGKSGIKGLLSGRSNMNSLMIIGAIISFAYSALNMALRFGDLYFFEATATILSFAMLGHFFESYSFYLSQSEIRNLIKKTVTYANVIAFNEDKEEVYLKVPNASLKTGDLIFIKTGEQVPSDCKILSGSCSVDESILTGESIPLFRKEKEQLLGGSVIIDGVIKAQVTADTSHSVMQHIIKMVEDAQREKSPAQKAADKISSFFIPSIFIVSAASFIINYQFVHLSIAESLLRSIAILVIACPCALGMATPAAIAIGMGIAARKGIYFKKADGLEKFKSVRQIIFDKTGTLTKGNFVIRAYHSTIDENEFISLVCEIEKNSNHPIALSILNHWKERSTPNIRLKNIKEIKGVGMYAEDEENNIYKIGSAKILSAKPEALRSLFVAKNDICIGWINVEDELRPEAQSLIQTLKKKNIEPILLSGDQKSVCEKVARELGIERYYYEKLPKEKAAIVKELSQEKVTAMVGDGINDAPSLAQADIGIAVSNASGLSIQAASIVLNNRNIYSIYQAILLGKYTYATIIGNLVWAFGYNIIAVPVAHFGLLTPDIAALIMGVSDIVLILHSLKLYAKKV